MLTCKLGLSKLQDRLVSKPLYSVSIQSHKPWAMTFCILSNIRDMIVVVKSLVWLETVLWSNVNAFQLGKQLFKRYEMEYCTTGFYLRGRRRSQTPLTFFITVFFNKLFPVPWRRHSCLSKQQCTVTRIAAIGSNTLFINLWWPFRGNFLLMWGTLCGSETPFSFLYSRIPVLIIVLCNLTRKCRGNDQ